MFPEEFLVDRDRNQFSDIWKHFNIEERVSYHPNLDFDKDPDDLLIYDESDHFLFNNPKLFDEFTSENQCICFTATPGGDDKNYEAKILNHLGLKIIKDQDTQPSLSIQR